MIVRIVARWVGQTGNPRMSHWQLENMSNGGLGIRVVEPIGAGTKLDVRTHMGNFAGTVLRSRKDGEEYVLGIQRDAEK